MSRVTVRLLSTDFDGTVHEDVVRPGIPQALQRKIESLQRAGVTWVINTGRDLPNLRHSLEQPDIRVRPDYVVAVEREIYRCVGHGEYVPVEPWNCACTEDHADLFTELGGPLDQLKDHLRATYEAHFYEDTYSPICVVARDNDQMDEIEGTVRTSLRPFPLSQVVRNSIYMRLAHHGYTKGTALAEIQRLLGVGAEHTVVAGDHLNDLPMMHPTFGRHLIAPSNSVPPIVEQVRAHGGFLATRPAGLGTLEGLLALGL